MRILHIMLACFYNEGFTYQENILPQMNKKDGHEVKIIASTEVFEHNGQTGYCDSEKYINEEGIEVVRLSYNTKIPSKIVRKIRKYEGTWEEIDSFKPDIIFCHSLMFWDLNVISKYKIKNPHVKLYADFHSDFNNSATNFLSRNILHRMIYKPIIMKHIDEFEKLYYITYETKVFLQELYGIKDKYLEFYPLGGIIEDEKIRKKYRKEIREQLHIKDDEIMLLHSGKMDAAKKTVNILSAINSLDSNKIKLVILGVFEDAYEKQVKPFLAGDNRIIFEGWKSGSELRQYMYAADLYIQPGSQSAAAQNAVCSNCCLAVAPHISYKDLFGDRVFYVESKDEIQSLIERIITNPSLLDNKRKQCFLYAKEKLDYQVLSRVYIN